MKEEPVRLSLGPDLPEVSRVGVLGLARSGRAAVTALLERGVDVVATDARSREALSAEGELPGPSPEPGDGSVEYVLEGHPESFLDGIDLLIVSPGVPTSIPVLWAARARAIPLIAEVELASRLLPGLVVGVTGTNGKSTTTALIGELLLGAGCEAIACGNLGTPWIAYATRALRATSEGPGSEGLVAPNRVWVVELSSFQLEGLRRFAPDVAVFLNLTPDHLDRYSSLGEYGAAKARIFENQREAQVAVLNADDPLVSRVSPRARRFEFSRQRATSPGTFLEGEEIFAVTAPGAPPKRLAHRGDLALPGAHNTENLLAALAAALPFGLTPDDVSRSLRRFHGLPHRMVLVRTRAGVAYYNDSKGTNIDATKKSLEGFEDGRAILILGGKDKGDDFSRLRGLVTRKARRVLAIGAAGHSIVESLSTAVETVWVATLDRAVKEAASLARPGDVVLLSPACSSFDQFRNFEHRGEVFTGLVNALPEAEGSGTPGISGEGCL